MVKVFGCKGCGSTAIEALLELLAIPYESVQLEWGKTQDWDELKRWNPLGQVPTLVTPAGEVLSESAAIMLWLLDKHADNPLLPPPNSPERMALYRWLVFISANIYAAIIVGDFPERWVDGEAAQENLKEKSKTRVQEYWHIMENALTPRPYLLGATMTALDLYVAMVTRWRPGRAWFESNCPKLMAAVRSTEQNPVVAKVWARNFS